MRRATSNRVKRLLFGCYYLAACVAVPLAALWPTMDSNEQAISLVHAAYVGDGAAMDELLGEGVPVDCRDEIGLTPLMSAAQAGKLDAVRKLLAAGARIDTCGRVFGTPLMIATFNRRHEAMVELIRRGADPNVVNSRGHTALWYARIAADDEGVQILLAAGAFAEGGSSER
jgi:ankyrin repeat protein